MRNHPCDCACCQCYPCGHPKKEPPRQGVLLPKILCSGREWQRCLCVTLCVSGLPGNAQPPYTLVCVTQSEQPPVFVEDASNCAPRCLCGCARVPLRCVVRDACGCAHAASACLEMEARVPLHCPRAERWRHTLVIVPSVRLICPPVESADCRFDARLEALLCLYMVQWTPIYMRDPKPQCPDLPLYPQPFDPTLCARRCPTDPDPCGWQERG